MSFLIPDPIEITIRVVWWKRPWYRLKGMPLERTEILDFTPDWKHRPLRDALPDFRPKR